MAVIQKLAITQFRNLNRQYIKPGKHLNLFIASNAQGKTSLIEAIYYLGHNRSFKTKSLKELIQFDLEKFQLDAQVNEQRIKLEKSKQKTNITIDQLRLKNSSDLSKVLPIQIITPDKGFIVNGTPKNKRSYLDWGVFHVNLDFLADFKKYHKALKNINVLLMQQKSQELDDWFLEIAHLSKKINQARQDYIDQLKQTNSSQLISDLSNLFKAIDSFDYQFVSGWPKEVDAFEADSIYQYLLKSKPFMLKAKYLNYGPHKASLKFYLNQQEECFLSRGEQKTLSIVFWLTQVALMVKNNIQPVVLIDDISSELDPTKIQTILHFLQQLNIQIFMTDIGENILKTNPENTTVFRIDQGVISQQQ
ncbi:DNA replication/repair protein RecF [Candidatus Thioglobus sp.]|uniref:DNA replication/repair protein RecF n=1 Tax=Candidatus Thioglobus sp. TaxID=2026721 RepID=UPI003D0D1D80